MQDPSALVLAFIADHFRWNSAALLRDSQAGRSNAAQAAALEMTQQEYAALLGRYCRPGFTGESISYGIPPLHDPDREVITSVHSRLGRCLVKTRKTFDIGGVAMVQDFEYRVSCTAGRWYLESVKCVVDGGRYESL